MEENNGLNDRPEEEVKERAPERQSKRAKKRIRVKDWIMFISLGVAVVCVIVLAVMAWA